MLALVGKGTFNYQFREKGLIAMESYVCFVSPFSFAHIHI